MHRIRNAMIGVRFSAWAFWPVAQWESVWLITSCASVRIRPGLYLPMWLSGDSSSFVNCQPSVRIRPSAPLWIVRRMAREHVGSVSGLRKSSWFDSIAILIWMGIRRGAGAVLKTDGTATCGARYLPHPKKNVDIAGVGSPTCFESSSDENIVNRSMRSVSAIGPIV